MKEWVYLSAMLLSCDNTEMLEAGCDEAGRGCFAGPVFAAAVIMPNKFYDPLLNDSKQVSVVNRSRLRCVIEREAIAYSVSMVDCVEIDKINILNASIKAMHIALDNLSVVPQMLLIDGNRFHAYKDIPHKCIIKGDSIYASIAAASILAKTYRDEYMQNLSREFPDYDWWCNKGYGTRKHRAAIAQLGLTIHHRKSFNIAPRQPNVLEE